MPVSCSVYGYTARFNKVRISQSKRTIRWFILFQMNALILLSYIYWNLREPQVILHGDVSLLIEPNEYNSSYFEDDLFKPLMELYRKKATGTLDPQIKRFRNGNVPRVLLWSSPFDKKFWNSQLMQIRKGRCPLPCEVIHNVSQTKTVDAVVIYLRGAKDFETVTQNLWPRDPRQPWIMLTYEAPLRANSNHKSNYKSFNGLFNRTMMYRRDSDIRAPHGFIVKRGEDGAGALPADWVMPSMLERGNQSRRVAMTFMSNCKSNTNRLQYIREVGKYTEVDIYGNCGTHRCGHRMYVTHNYDVTKDPCLKMAGESYLFYFAFENSFCVDYVTEKAYNLLHFQIVPVVRGSAKYSSYFPPNSYLDASEFTPKELAEKLIYLRDNPLEYQKYLEWKKFYQPSTVGGERIMCHLCARLYDQEFYEHKVIEDFEDWFVKKSRCQE